MPSAFDDFFFDNLVNLCENESFLALNCILGFSGMGLSLLFIAMTIVGLLKLLNYYDHINFEILLLAFSIMQIIILDLIILYPHDLFFEIFFVIQIIQIICTIRKILDMIGTNKIKENFIFSLLTVINFVIFTFYLLSLLEIILNEFYSYFQSLIRIFYFITVIILTFLCRSLIKKIRLVEKSNEAHIHAKRVSSSTTYSHNSNIFVSFKNNDWMFFLIRERQVHPLYILNLICSSCQMIFILCKHFILNGFFEKQIYVVKTQKREASIIYYIYILFCFLNVLVNYFCFYWVVRDQYIIDKDDKDPKKKKLLDNTTIKRITTNNLDDDKNISVIIDEEKKKDQKLWAKSIYSNTFSEVNEDPDKEKDKYFIKKEDELDEKSLKRNPGRLTGNSTNVINNSIA